MPVFCKDCKHVKILHKYANDYAFTKCTYGIKPTCRSLVSGEFIEPEYPYCSTQRASNDPNGCGAEGRNYEPRT